MSSKGASSVQTLLRWQQINLSGRPAGLKIACLATSTIDPLVPYLGVALEDAGLAADIQVGPYNQIMQQCLSDTSDTARCGPDILVVYARFEELWANQPFPLQHEPGFYQRDLLQIAETAVDAAQRWGARLVFVLPAIPEHRPLGIGDDGHELGVVATATAAREALRGYLIRHSDTLILDLENVIRSVGSAQAYNYPMLALAKIPFAEAVFALWGQSLARLIRLSYRPSRQILVVDPDNTLWAGRVEQGRSEVLSANETYLSLQSYLLDLQRAGVQLVCWSAGADDNLSDVFSRPEMQIRREHWHGWLVQQRSMTAALQSLAAGLGVDLAQIVLLTADRSMVDEVLATLPQVTVIAMPDDPAQWLASMQAAGAFDRLPASNVASSDHAPQHKDISGALDTGEPLSLERFLASLNVELSFVLVGPEHVAKVADLTEQVAEFHLTGLGRTEAEVREISASDGVEAWVIYVRDRLSNYGLSGVVICRAHQQILQVDTLILTCPVLGKRVEHQVIAWLQALAHQKVCDRILLEYRPTPRNHAILEFLSQIAATSTPVTDGGCSIELVVTAEPSRPPVLRAASEPVARPHVTRRAGLDASIIRHHIFTSPAASGVVQQIATRFQTAAQILEGLRQQTRHVQAAPEQRATPRTPREALLAGVWADVLKVDQIGVETSFLKLGGDSIRAIQIVSRLNQAGVHITPKHIFLHQTIAKIAEIIDQLPAIKAEQGVVTGAVPITPAQHWFFDLIAPRLPVLHHYNHAYYLELQEPLDPETLEAAIHHLVIHHDALRLRFRQVDGTWTQMNAGIDNAARFSYVTVADLPASSQEAAIAEAIARYQTTLDLANGPLMRAIMFDLGPHAPSRLLLIVHHLLVDGFSRWILLEDLQTACTQLQHQEPVRLPAKTTAYKHWATQIGMYAQTAELRSELDYWLAVSHTPLAHVPADFPDGMYTYESTEIVRTALSRETTQHLAHVIVQTHDTSVDAILLTALVVVLQQWAAQNDLLIAVSGHGREALFADKDVSRTVGWFQYYYPVAIHLESRPELAQALQSVTMQLRRVPNSGIGYGLLRYLTEDGDIAAQMRSCPHPIIDFNYMGEIGFEEVAPEHSLFGVARTSVGPLQHPDGVWPYMLDIFASMVGGQLMVEWMYSSHMYRRSTIEHLARQVEAVLQTLSADPALAQNAGLARIS